MVFAMWGVRFHVPCSERLGVAILVVDIADFRRPRVPAAVLQGLC